MKLFAMSMVVAGVLAGVPGWQPGEPSERDMQLAFEGALAIQVRNAIDFAGEAGGPEAITAIRENGTDQFAVSAFRKLKCQRDAGRTHRCDFQVDLDLSNGKFERKLSGHFVKDAQGLRYFQEI